MTWHVEVPMIATIWPGSTACAAGAVTGTEVDPVSLWLRGVVAPKLDEGVRTGGELWHLTKWCSVRQSRDHRACGEVSADPDHVRWVDTGQAKGLRHRDLQDRNVVRGHLQLSAGAPTRANVASTLRHVAVSGERFA